MMERLTDRANCPPSAGKLTDSQIATRSTWSTVPDRDATTAAMHIIHAAPSGASTVTELNPLDPGTVAEGAHGDTYLGWLARPGAYGRVIPARFGPDPEPAR